ncbi:phosphotransferase family protein [Sphingomonas sp.]|uniref:phosphotransferase family protein n=1 Tax=Sphingomonas sp. TaxID=28214 RepID=UPI001EBADF74|nr:phosphotransferase family protein [Sphingomonas sp.]MBX3595038.1 phosphotransferase family protein [Sphingomonas sp.]
MSGADDAAIAALVRHWRPDTEVTRIERHFAGASSDIWMVDAVVSGAEWPLVVRMPALTLADGGLAREFDLLRVLADTVVPVPEAYLIDASGRFLGRPAMLIERVAGVADRKVHGTGASRPSDPTLSLARARAVANALADIHHVDPTTLPLPPADADPARSAIDAIDAQIRRHEREAMPELRLAMLWLRENAPPAPERRALVHGDFRPANLMIDGSRITAVLDWEFSHIGDPAADIGWYLTPYYRADHLIAGAWEAEDFLSCYEARLGAFADRAAIRFWSIHAMVRLAAIALASLDAFRAGESMRIMPSAEFVVGPLLATLAEEAA